MNRQSAYNKTESLVDSGIAQVDLSEINTPIFPQILVLTGCSFMARLSRIGGTVELSQPVREHKNTSQQQKIQHQIERTVEEQRLARLKAALQAKLEPSYSANKIHHA